MLPIFRKVLSTYQNQTGQVAQCLPLHSHRPSWRITSLYGAPAFAILLIATPLTSDAGVIYKIVDSTGKVTYSDHAPAAAVGHTVTKVNQQTGAVLAGKAKSDNVAAPAALTTTATAASAGASNSSSPKPTTITTNVGGASGTSTSSASGSSSLTPNTTVSGSTAAPPTTTSPSSTTTTTPTTATEPTTATPPATATPPTTSTAPTSSTAPTGTTTTSSTTTTPTTSTSPSSSTTTTTTTPSTTTTSTTPTAPSSSTTTTTTTPSTTTTATTPTAPSAITTATSANTPSAPATTTACSGVPIDPSFTADRLQQAVDSNPAGTTFCFNSGTYVINHYVKLRESNKFICPARRTCILTGLDKYRGAFSAEYNTTHHLIKGFVAEHFIAQDGVWPLSALEARDYGVLEDNEVRYNQTGIEIKTNVTLRGNYIHHNRRYGISGGPGNDMLIENNELAWNNTGHYDPNNDAGGSKIVGGQAGTNRLTWRGNYVHNNYGQGIWSDGNVRYVLYENNRIENNTGVGIDHEISWDAVIRNNYLANNNTAEKGLGKSCWWGSAIAVNNSQTVEIYSNTVVAEGTNAICMVNSNRSEQAVFPQALANIHVHDNVVKMRGDVATGMVGNSAPSNVVFINNTYYADNLSAALWAYYQSDITKLQWQAAGQDLSGKFLTW